MGFFGTYLYNGQGWSAHQSDHSVDVSEPWLVVDVYDSDITTLTYRPSGPGTGTAFLGHTPRTYFEDDAASAPMDVNAEAVGLANWLTLVRHDQPDVTEVETLIADYLAADGESSEIDDEGDEDADDLDDAEIFVEIKTKQFLQAIGLPVPEELDH